MAKRGTYTDRVAVGFGFACLLVAAAVLEFLIIGGFVNGFIVPRPSDVVLSLERIVLEEHVLLRLAATTAEAAAVAALITLVGVPTGFALYRSRRLRAAFEPWVAALAAAPLVLAYPLFMVLFGRGAGTIVAIGFLAGLAPVVLKTTEGFAGTRRVLLDVGRSLRATPMQQFWKILFPAAVPAIFTGIRLGLVFSLITIVGVEFLINFGGLGQLINDLAERYDLPGTYAAILFVILVSVMFFAGMERIEQWLQPSD